MTFMLKDFMRLHMYYIYSFENANGDIMDFSLPKYFQFSNATHGIGGKHF